ncbi:MAG: ATP-dependent Clp protease ATP-binding subunit ClpC [Trebonia sp.]|jgi:ATP-dependent Clp protease ATP-binding subunit ClpC|nr:ATP-dependent Clp protease ATP-binding subunit ClpC [Trebonia sp.]
MFERFTEQSRRAVVLAQEEARMLGHNHIGSEHLLLGLLHEQDGAAAVVLGSAGITLEAARSQVEDLAGPGDKAPSGHIPFTQRAKKILELSLREALEQKKSYIGTEHILLALMRDADGTGARVLERLGGSLPALRQQVLEVAKATAPDPAAERETEHGMWAVDWRRAQGFAREARVPPLPPPAAAFRQLLTPIDRRLAGIERHLGIADDEEAVPGFRGLLMSVNRHLASIERHLGIADDDEAGEQGPPATAE